MSPIDPIPNIPIPPSVDRRSGIGEASRNVLIRFLVDVFNRLKDGLSSMIRHAIESTFESLERSGLAMGGSLIDRVLDQPEIPPDIRAVLVSARSGEHQVGAVVVIGALVAMATQLFPAAIAGVVGQLRNASYRIFRPGVLDAQSAFRAYALDNSRLDLMYDSLEKQGLTEEQIAALWDASFSRLGVSDLMVLFMRGDLELFEFDKNLREIGFDADQLPMLQKLVQQIPGPSDLVRFGLREAWRDDVAARYGYDQGQPAVMTDWMAKQGYGPEWAQAFWRSHWELPSVGQMIEMFHRQEIDRAALVDGLKVNDVAPGWIDPLLGITYNLLTRVDVKRALRYGEYEIEDVFLEYRKLGYDEVRARILTNIAVKETLDDAAGLTRSAIVAAYKKGRMNRAQAIETLGDIGILEDIAGFYLDQADFDRADALQDQRIANIEKRFKAGLLSESDALSELALLGVGGDESRLEVESWGVARQTAVKRPSRANLDEFVNQGILDSDTYRSELDSMGYDARYIGWYVGSLAFETAIAAAKEDERVQKERVRILADRRSSTYEKAKAEIDRDIAELNSAIADAQVALVELQNQRDRRLDLVLPARVIAEMDAQYLPLFREVDGAIAAARLSIQTLRTEITAENATINDLRRSIVAGRDLVEDAKLRNEQATLGTSTALLDQQIAQRRTDIARLTEAIPLAESAEQQADLKQTILTLKTQMAEFAESKADGQVRIVEIDALLPVELTAERKSELLSDVRDGQARADEWRLQIADLEEGIRQTQVERLAIENEYRSAVEAVPGRAEQIEIRAEYAAKIDVVQARIGTLRSNVADRRLDKTALVVEWRS